MSMRDLKYFLRLKSLGKSKKVILQAMQADLMKICTAGRPSVFRHPPGQFETSVSHPHSDFEMLVSYDVYYEPEQRGGWDDPSWGASTELEDVWIERRGYWREYDPDNWLKRRLESDSMGQIVDNRARDAYEERHMHRYLGD